METGTSGWRAYVGLVSTTRISLVMLFLTRNNSPYTTDPVSDRVVEMAERYTEFPFNDAEDWFGEMAMYVRKD